MPKFTFYDMLRILRTPSCWVRNYSTDRAWDYRLNMLMDIYGITSMDNYYAMFENERVWIGNYPHCYGKKDHKLPSRTTCFRLRDMELKFKK